MSGWETNAWAQPIVTHKAKKAEKIVKQT